MSQTAYILAGVTFYIVSIIILIIVLNIINNNEKKRYRKEINSLEREKNLIISSAILSEIHKVEALISNNDRMQEKLEDWKEDDYMKLILTSRVFGDPIATEKVLNELDMDLSQTKILLIATPRLPFEGPESSIESLINHGFNRDNIIVFNHEEPEKYCDLDLDIIYVTGGNTFTGLKLLKDSGFAEEIIKYVNNGVIYLGKSAGAHIASKNVEHVLEFDENFVGLEDFEGLGLFDGILVCHYSDERKTCYTKLLSEDKYNVYTLTDQEVIKFDDSLLKKK